MDRTQELLHTRNVRRQMSFRLALWAGGSMIVALIGFAMQPSIPPGAARAIGQALAAQCLLWGLVDVGFALFGLKHAQSAERSPVNQATADRELSDRDKLVRVLQFSWKLNIFWVGLGILLIVVGAALPNATLIGHGVGVMIQGGFLWLFDGFFLKSLSSVKA
jgi:hypothetical protein